MKTLEQEILETNRLIGNMSAVQVRIMEKALRDLTPRQSLFVRNTLNQARQQEQLPVRYLRLLEHFFEKWSSHSLATHLVLVGRLTDLASKMPVEEGTSDTPALDIPFDLPAGLVRTSE